MKSKLYSLVISLITLTAFAMPVSALAYDDESDPTLGTIVINVTDKYGNDFSGNWYLYLGSMLIRNGMKSYSFKAEPKTYTLETRKVNHYPYRVITSENPQTLTAEGTITYSVMYFKTEEEMLAAEANGYAFEQEPAEEETIVEEEPESEPEEEEENETVEEEEETVVSSATSSPAAQTGGATVYVPTFETAPQTFVPDFSTPPAASNTDPDVVDFATVPELPATGPAAFALIFSSLAGVAMFRRKK